MEEKQTNFRAFNNYMNTVQNAIDAGHNHHPDDCEKAFENHGRWALHLLEKVFDDKEQNIRRWLNGKPCVYFHPGIRQTVSVQIGNDLEALFYFLTFIEKHKNREPIDEDFVDYLALIISRSNCKDWEEC